MFKILFAPLQGYTTGIYRKAHAEFIGGVDAYYAPFLRVESGKPRAKDLRDLDVDSNVTKITASVATAEKTTAETAAMTVTTATAKTVPQIIANSVEEFRILANALQDAGFTEIDFNMGCPFPMQVNHHRGAGLLSDAATVAAIMEEIAKSQAKFSVKMRLGQNDAEEAFVLLPILNATPLLQITLHPRLGKQQYKGALDFASFRRFYGECKHPLYFNGDVTTVEQICELERKFPNLAGVMIGRGLLANPFLAREYKARAATLISSEATSLDATAFNSSNTAQRLSLILQMHAAMMDFACSTYQGDSQILSHLQSFWEYQEANLPKKIFKRIRKAGTVAEYRDAVASLAQGVA